VEKVAIILARGGSKEVLNKNLLDFFGVPLLAHTIINLQKAGINIIYVSSDSSEILNCALKFGASPILRPKELSCDYSSSESGWIHAINEISAKCNSSDWIIAPQVTSPLTQIFDFIRLVSIINTENYDSILSVVPTKKNFLWKQGSEGIFPINHDITKRKMRQEYSDEIYVENGAFYAFRKTGLMQSGSRFHGKIGICKMKYSQKFQIDSYEDLELCRHIYKSMI
jgi:N-acylneuraminate cytidylyltransferase